MNTSYSVAKEIIFNIHFVSPFVTKDGNTNDKRRREFVGRQTRKEIRS